MVDSWILQCVSRMFAGIQAEVHQARPLRCRQTPVSRLLAKLAARDRAQLVIVAHETGQPLPARLTRQLAAG